MKKWTLEKALRAVNKCTGLTKCSALDYLNKNHPNWKTLQGE